VLDEGNGVGSVSVIAEDRVSSNTYTLTFTGAVPVEEITADKVTVFSSSQSIEIFCSDDLFNSQVDVYNIAGKHIVKKFIYRNHEVVRISVYVVVISNTEKSYTSSHQVLIK
jgi:hypothetical protein